MAIVVRALSRRPSVPLADDRRAPTTSAPRTSTTCARSSSATTIRRNASLALAGDIDAETGARAGRGRYFGEIPRRREARGGRQVAPPERARRTTSGWCSRIASSCRGSTWRGTRRRCSPTATPSWISWPKCCRAARRRGCIARSSTSSASPRKSRRRRTRARLGSFFQIVATAAPGPHARGGRARDHEGDRRLHRAAGRPPRELERCLAQAEAHFLFRLQTVGGFGGKSDQLNAYNMFLGDPGYFEQDLRRYRSATTGAAARRRGQVAQAEPARRSERRPARPRRAGARAARSR